jgi:hypothetical protein
MPAAEPAKGTLETAKLPGKGFEPEKGFGLKGELENALFVIIGVANGSGVVCSNSFLK